LRPRLRALSTALSRPHPLRDSPIRSGDAVRQLRLVLPSTQDPLAYLTALVAHMQQQFGAEVECYDIDLQGGVKVDLRIRVVEPAKR